MNTISDPSNRGGSSQGFSHSFSTLMSAPQGPIKGPHGYVLSVSEMDDSPCSIAAPHKTKRPSIFRSKVTEDSQESESKESVSGKFQKRDVPDSGFEYDIQEGAKKFKSGQESDKYG